tara:strand:- start:98 stop:763 length:666 start_codon:yes stop_codon:yes gene_type:complete
MNLLRLTTRHARRATLNTRSFQSSTPSLTTIVTVRKDNQVAVVGDGQISLGPTIMKPNATKVRRLGVNKEIIVGFAGSTSDALALMDRLEMKLEQYPDQLMRACVELSKGWRTDKYLRRLDAVLLVANKDETYELTGNGDVIEMTTDEAGDGAMAIGSGGAYALAAARAYLSIDTHSLTAKEIAEHSLGIAGDICVYTNKCAVVETIENDSEDTDDDKKKD